MRPVDWLELGVLFAGNMALLSLACYLLTGYWPWSPAPAEDDE